MNLFDLCVHFNGVLSGQECDEMIAMYEENIDKSVSNKIFHSEKFNYDNSSWHEMNMEYPPYKDKYDVMIKQRNELMFNQYKEKFADNYFFRFPHNYHYSGPRIKKYETNGTDQFDWHADTNAREVADRFLVFLYYLNDVPEGGETIIATQDERTIAVKPKKGSVLVFPPYWMFTHCAAPPISNPKYIISSYGRVL